MAKVRRQISVAAGAKEVATYVPWSELVYMQDMTVQACDEAQLYVQRTLIDIRDGNSYNIMKIQNKTNTYALCWMTQNLRIIDKNITANESDITSDFVIPASNLSSFNSSTQYQPKVYYDSSKPEYGAYYNWYTATAGSGDVSVTDGNASYSICPKGWRLPTGGDKTGDFYNLLYGLSGAQITEAPYSFMRAGIISSEGLHGADSNGWYLSATAFSADIIYNLNFNNSSVNLSNTGSYSYNQRHYGYPVRCVAR